MTMRTTTFLLALVLASAAPASAQTSLLSWRGASMGACLETDPDQCLSVAIEQRLDDPEVNNPVGTFLTYILSRWNGFEWVTVESVFQREIPAAAVKIAPNASRATLNLPTIQGVWTTFGAWTSAGDGKDYVKTPVYREVIKTKRILNLGKAVVIFEGETYVTTGKTVNPDPDGNPQEDSGTWGQIGMGTHKTVVRE
jgi:hypothetical protein